MLYSLITILVLLLAAPAWGWGATYYVSPSGSNTSPYDTWAKAATSIQTVVDAASGTGDLVYIGGGTYAQAAQINVDRPSIALYGDSGLGGVNQKADGGGLYGPSGRTIIDQSALNGTNFYMTGASAIISHIDFASEDQSANIAIRNASATASTITGCRFYSTGYAIQLDAAAAEFLITKNLFAGSVGYATDSGLSIYAGGDAGGGTIAHNIFRPHGNSLPARIRTAHSTKTWIVANNVMIGMPHAAFYATAAGTTYLQNNIIIGGALGSTPGDMILNSNAHVFHSTNNYLPPSGSEPASANWYQFAPDTNTSNIYDAIPKINSFPRFGYIFAIFDDTGTFTEAKTAADTYFNPNGQFVSVALNAHNLSTLTQADVQAFVNSGNDVLSHGYSHTALNTTNIMSVSKAEATTIAFTPTRPDAANPTGWSAVVELAGATTGTYNVTASTTYGQLKSWLESQGCTVSYSTAQIGTAGLASTIDAKGATSINGGTTLAAHEASLLTVEITYGNTLNQAFVRSGASGRAATYTIKGFAAPFNISSNNAMDKVAAAGLRFMRGDGNTYADGSFSLDQMLVFDICNVPIARFLQDCTGHCDDGGASEESIFKRNTAAMLVGTESAGWVKMLYIHTAAVEGFNTTELQWLAELSKDMNHANFKIKINDWADMIWGGTDGPDGNVWTVGAGDTGTPDRTLRFDHVFVDLSDFRLKTGSPAIDAGTPVFTAAQLLSGGDMAGNHYVYGSAPDIGAYEYQDHTFGGWFFEMFIPTIFNLCASTNANCYTQP